MQKVEKKLDTFLESMQVDYYGEERDEVKEAVKKALGNRDDLSEKEWNELADEHGTGAVGDAYVALKSEGEYEGTEEVEEEGEEALEIDDEDDVEDEEESIEIDDEEPVEEGDCEEDSIIEMDEAKRAVQFESRHYEFLVNFISKILANPVLKVSEGSKKFNDTMNVILQELAPTNPGFKREAFESKLRKAFKESASSMDSAKEDIK